MNLALRWIEATKADAENAINIKSERQGRLFRSKFFRKERALFY